MTYNLLQRRELRKGHTTHTSSFNTTNIRSNDMTLANMARSPKMETGSYPIEISVAQTQHSIMDVHRHPSSPINDKGGYSV
jgi:hypothetical protein